MPHGKPHPPHASIDSHATAKDVRLGRSASCAEICARFSFKLAVMSLVTTVLALVVYKSPSEHISFNRRARSRYLKFNTSGGKRCCYREPGPGNCIS
jgi:hypothetical protein